MKKTLMDVMPSEFMGCEYENTLARKFSHVEVISEYYSHVHRWPGSHKNVHFWCELKNGKAVGWNESPSHGWSFPVITLKRAKKDAAGST